MHSTDTRRTCQVCRDDLPQNAKRDTCPDCRYAQSLAALDETTARALLAALDETTADREGLYADALAHAARMIGTGRRAMARDDLTDDHTVGVAAVVRSALATARNLRARRDARTARDNGITVRSAASLDAILAATREALDAMPAGRLTAADPDPASRYRITPTDVRRVTWQALAALDATAYDLAARWVARDAARAPGRRTQPDPGQIARAQRAAVLALDAAGDPCGDAHPRRHRTDPRSIGGGWQETTDHGPIPVGRVTVTTADGRTLTRDLTPAEVAALAAPAPGPTARPGETTGDTAPLQPDPRQRTHVGRSASVVGEWDPNGRLLDAATRFTPCTHENAVAGPHGCDWHAVPVPGRAWPVWQWGRYVPVMERQSDGTNLGWDAARSRGVTAPSRRKRGADGPTTLAVGARTR